MGEHNREAFFVDELLAYQEWKARYKVEVQADEKLERKLEGCFDIAPMGNYYNNFVALFLERLSYKI